MNEKDIEWMELLKAGCPEIFVNNEPELFRRFLCPISIVDADVKEYVVDEYESIELLVLRLYSQGIHSAELLSDLTGIDERLAKKLLYSEMYLYGHISPENGEITPAGKQTLKENLRNSDTLYQHKLYDAKRELQVDSITGTLIRAEAEMRKSSMVDFNDRIRPILVPRNQVEIDAVLYRELRERLLYYVESECIKGGGEIRSITRFHAKEIKYRPAYYVKMTGFEHAFVAIRYAKYTEGVRKDHVIPIALSWTDFNRLENPDPKKYLARNDTEFVRLDAARSQFEALTEEEEILSVGLLEEQQEALEDIGEENYVI